MRNLVMGCAVAALVALSARSEARPPEVRMLESRASVGLRTQTGVASWYGAEFQGLPMASGQPYNMNNMTCAHRELPLGTRIMVTNLLNSRSLILKVTDRGPVAPGRMLDVSMAAAKRLGFLGQGLTPVRIQVLSYPQDYLVSQISSSVPAPTAN
ncbi:MAG TPA: septal ring lytic transglycosylase RlpA family protein [Terriglobia bacterium]|nr:septal ring lytic transglycosylase RlpA family protein [Terriglobia bacterium]